MFDAWRTITKTVTLNNGVEMPALGFGVFQMCDLPNANAASSTPSRPAARLIDTAAAYPNEEAVGRGLKGAGVRRHPLLAGRRSSR